MMSIKHGFAAILGVMGLTLVAGCVGEVDENDATASEDVGVAEEALQTIGRVNIYGQSQCWSSTNPMSVVPCGSAAIFNLDDGRTYGTSDVYYRFYTSTTCVTANANGTITLTGCNISNNTLADDNQRWLPVWNARLNAYQLRNKLYNAYLRKSPYSSKLELFGVSNASDPAQLWQAGVY